MKLNITRRDIKFFFLGILTSFVISVIYDWESNLDSFKKGYEDGRGGNLYGTSK